MVFVYADNVESFVRIGRDGDHAFAAVVLFAAIGKDDKGIRFGKGYVAADAAGSPT
ncbi:hypothetical protein [Nocardia acidivorans]|uniref:hypothetical protein n=1 Tax=Nocardia acidivorans TaxID=404580 RepID=UPI0012F9CB44|nr:hypothetical protein [Nocardia acidivorans]